MVQSQKDTTKASIVALVLCALIFIYGYNETGRPIKATVCLLFGLAYTFAFATLTVGHLNILTITFLPMLIGLAIDFGVHLITRYEEELRHGKSEAEALTKAMVFTGQGIFTGALTTAGAFRGDGVHPFQRHSRNGHHLRRRPDGLPRADDDDAAGACCCAGGRMCWTTKSIWRKSGRGSKISGCNGRCW